MSYSVNNKSKVLIAVIVVVVAIVGIIGTVAYSQRGNIEALAYVKKYSGEERRKMLEDNEKAILDILERLPEVKVQPLDEKAEKMLREGKLSKEDAVLIITGRAQTEDFDVEVDVTGSAEVSGVSENEAAGDKTVQNASDQADSTPETNVSNGESTGGQSQPASEQEKPSELESLVAQIYILRSDFSGQLDSLVSQAKAEYIANKGKNKAGIAGKYLRKATDLEALCDSQMEETLSKIDVEIKRTGGDTEIVSEIRSAYENEKSIKKADLLAKYNK